MSVSALSKEVKQNRSRREPKMPDNPRGVSGLAALLKYVVELKAYKIDVGLLEKTDANVKLGGLAGVLQQNFANKM
jgi:hypothetical protein